MTDDPLPPLIHRAAGPTPASFDLAAVKARGRRRRTARLVASSVAAVVVLVGAGLAVAARPARQVVQLAPAGSASPAAARPAGAVRTLPPQAEGEAVATPDGFVLVSGAVPTQVWFSADGRWWVRQPARGLATDLLVDVGVTPDGAIVALATTGDLWVSDDDGASWRRVPLPDDLGRVTQVSGDRQRWYLAGASRRDARLLAVLRDGADRVEAVDGDLAVERFRGDDVSAAMVASGAAGTVLIADGRPEPTVWLITGDLAATRVDGAFGIASVTGVSATDDGFAATVLPAGATRPEVWRSPDGRSWTATADRIPAPTCAEVVESGAVAVASGSPCDQDAGWELWRRADDGWVRIGREVERR